MKLNYSNLSWLIPPIMACCHIIKLLAEFDIHLEIVNFNEFLTRQLNHG